MMKTLLTMLMFMTSQASAEYLLSENMERIIKEVEEVPFVRKAFFHDGFWDIEKDTFGQQVGNDLGIFYKNNFGSKETTFFFKERAFTLCKVIYRNAGHKGKIKIYFYKRALLRKYNEEGLAYCGYSADQDKIYVSVESRAGRYLESFGKTIGNIFQFLFLEP